MKRNKVESSNIISIGYDPEIKVLQIEFHSGGVYNYEPVEQELYHEMLVAKSIGSFFHKNIRMNKELTFKEVSTKINHKKTR